MKKWIKRILIGTLIFLLLIVVVGLYVFKQAFGPIESSRIIKIDDNYTLNCKQTYNADLAAVFYDVDFTLTSKTGLSKQLGSGTFSNKNWYKNLRLFTLHNWYILPVDESNYGKLLLANKNSSLKIDTTFSPLNLRYDSSWKNLYKDIPAWTYYGTSHIDTVIGNKINVTYTYRIGDYEPFKFYRQTLMYKIDTSGNVTTEKVFERTERKNGS
jgi:uncharacterized protein YxeA